MMAGGVEYVDSGHDPPPWGHEEDIFHVSASYVDVIPIEDRYRGPTSEELDEASDSRLIFATIGNPKSNGGYLLDSGANASCSKDLLGTDASTYVKLEQDRVKITGIGGASIGVIGAVKLERPLDHIWAWHSPDAVRNIVSLDDVQQRYDTQFLDQNTQMNRIGIYERGTDKLVQVAKKVGKFYLYQPDERMAQIFSFSANADPKISVGTGAENPSGYTSGIYNNVLEEAQAYGLTKDAIKRALLVERYHRSYSYVNLDSLENMVRRSAYGFGGITPGDVRNYKTYIHAKRCMACRLGKTTAAPKPILTKERAFRPGQRIIADILFVKSSKFARADPHLLTIDEYCSVIHIKHIDSRSIKAVSEAFKSVVDDYARKGWKVEAIKMDKEGAFQHLADGIGKELGIRTEPCIADLHAVVAERAIRTVIGLFRASISGLPYVLAPHLYTRLLEYVATSCNLVSHANNDVLTPYELFFQRPPNLASFLRMEFGELASYHDKSTQSDQPRAIIGMVVARDMETPGAAYIWDMSNRTTKSRMDYKPISWNSAFFNQYLEAAVESGTMDKSKFVEASDLDISSEWIDRMTNQQPGNEMNEEDDIEMIESNSSPTQRTDIIADGTENRQLISKKIDEARLMSSIPHLNDLVEETEEVEFSHKDIPEEEDHPTSAALGNEASMAEEPTMPYRSETTVPYRVKMGGSHRRDHDIAMQEMNKNLNEDRPDGLRPRLNRSTNILNMTIRESKMKCGENNTIDALIAELSQMGCKGVWEAKTPKQLDQAFKDNKVKNILTSSMFLKDKYDANGLFVKLKARLVAHGNRQLFDEIFGSHDVDSPTASLAVILILLHLTAKEGWHVRVNDVAGAYLNANLRSPEFMKLSKELVDIIEAGGTDDDIDKFKQSDGSIVVELKKALYGLRQAGREWYSLLHSVLEANGYVRSKVDKCLYTRIVGNSTTHIAVYVDDLLMVGNDPQQIERITQVLRDKFGKITIQEGTSVSFVGIEINRSTGGDIQLRQMGYINELLTFYEIDPNSREDSPCNGNVMEASKSEEEMVDPKTFKSALMKLMYLSTRTRPDIAFAVSALSSRSVHPKKSDMTRLHKIFRYLNGTKEAYMIFKAGGHVSLSAFVDASFMTHPDMKSHTGYCIFADDMGSAGIIYRSLKQKTVSNSSTEAEIIALHELVMHLIWVQSIYDDLRVPNVRPAEVFEDNQAAITMSTTDVVNFKGRSKYINRKYFSIFEHVQTGEVKVVFVGTEDQVADFLTKALTGGKFKRFRIAILGNRIDNVE